VTANPEPTPEPTPTPAPEETPTPTPTPTPEPAPEPTIDPSEVVQLVAIAEDQWAMLAAFMVIVCLSLAVLIGLKL